MLARARRTASTASASLSIAVTRARSARRNANGPTPQNRSATVLASAQWLSTSLASAISPACVACRKAPGGSTRCARPMRSVGAAGCAIISPWRVRRASRCCSRRAQAPPCAEARAVLIRARPRRCPHPSRSPGCRGACVDRQSARRWPRRRQLRRADLRRGWDSDRSRSPGVAFARQIRPRAGHVGRGVHGKQRAGALRHAHRSDHPPRFRSRLVPAPR